jgi:hypothetical protein
VSELQKKLKAEFWYSRDTGLFVRKARCTRSKAATVSGWVMLNGYIGMCFGGKQHYAHRLAWLYQNGELPPCKIDHVNGLRTDNRIGNLRAVSDVLNGQNVRVAHRDSKTGLLGVTYEPSSGRFMAQLWSKGRRWSARFDTAQAAHDAYLEKKRQMHPGCTI